MNIQNEEKPHFSASQLMAYLQCPLQYYFQYEEGIAWKTTPSAVAFGGVMHKALERLNESLYLEEPPKLDQITDDFIRYWTQEVEGNNISWAKPEESAELMTKGQEMLAIYYDAFKEVKPKAVEQMFRVPILDPTTGLYVVQRDIVGKMDMLGEGVIYEIKTSGRTPGQEEIDNNLQITIYSLAYRFIYGRPESVIRVVVLVKTKQPKLEVVETKRTEKDHTRLVKLVDKILKQIENKVFYPNPVGFSCSGCQYRQECEDWK